MKNKAAIFSAIIVLVFVAVLTPKFSQAAQTKPSSAGRMILVPYVLGDVFAGVGAGHINHYDSTGTFIEQLNTTSGSAEETGMCFDASGNLYTSNFGAANMSKFDNAGALLTQPWAGPFSVHPESCVVDATGNIFTGEVDGASRIRKWTPDGTLLASYALAPQARGADWIDLAADQCTMYYTSEGSSVKRFDTCANTQLPDFATGLAAPCYALRILPNTGGEVMATCATQAYHLNSSGGIIRTYPTSAYGDTYWFAMNLDPDGTSFWTGDYHTGHIHKIDIATGTQLTSFVAQPNGVSMAGLAVFGEITVGQPTPTVTVTGTPPTATETRTPGATATETQQATITETPAATETPAISPTEARTETATPTDTAVTTPLATITITETPTDAPRRSATPTRVPTGTRTPTGTISPVVTITNTPTASATTVPAFTNTATPVPTLSETNTDTPVVVSTDTVTPAPDNVLVGHVVWQSISQPNSHNVGITATLTLCVSGAPVVYHAPTDASGFFTVTTGLADGTYTYRIKGVRNLATSSSLTLAGSVSNKEFGTQTAGDANNDNVITAQDFNVVKTEFGLSGNSMPGDFNSDGLVNSQDFNMLKGNFGLSGAGANCP